MAEPGKETLPSPPPPQPEPAAVVEPVEGISTPPPPPQEAEPTAGVASALDPEPPTAELARQAAPQEEPDDAAAAEAGGQPLAATEPMPPSEEPPLVESEEASSADEEEDAAPEGVGALPPPPSDMPTQETVAAAAADHPVEAENELTAAAALPPPLPPQEASSVHGAEGEEKPEEGKVAAAGRAQEGEEKPEEKLAAPPPAMAPDGRRRWRQLQAAVRLMFLHCKRAPCGGDQSTPQSPRSEHKEGESKPPASGQDGKKPTPADEGEMKPSAPDGKQPAPEEAATSPPPDEATAAETTEKPPPEHASSVQEGEKDTAAEGDGKLARRRWRWLRAAVNLIFLRPKPKDKEDEGEAKPSAPALGKIEQKPAPAPTLQGEEITGGVPDKVGVKEKGEREESKGDRHDRTQAGAAAGDDTAGPEGTPAPPAAAGSMAKRFQKAGKRLMRIMSWYKRHRSSSRVGGEPEAAAAPTEEEGKGDGDKGSGADAATKTALAPTTDGKQPASGTEKEEEGKPKPPHPKWAREEERLEKILEDAFTRLLAAEFHQLRPIRKKCLLTFSVFDLAAEVKKQAMLYWWVSEFNLRHRSDQPPNKSATDDAAAPVAETTTARRRRSSCWQQARKSKPAAPVAGGNQSPASPPSRQGNNLEVDAEGMFSELSSHGFLEPMKNWCTRAIHGCKVNPLVHWMVKRRARDDRFADLDVKGNPAVLQYDSGILCLTAANRRLLQKLRMEDESQQAGSKPKTARTASSSSLEQSATEDKEAAQDSENIQPIPNYDEIARLFKGKQVILNINAHVYPVSKSTFLYLADCLVVLQLGRWCNLDDDTYMEVDGIESLRTIGFLKNLRYLSLRGLSRLTELPRGIRWLKKLAILDMRGCQNLVNVASNITTSLKQLTHLDLTECYMLEHIGRGIISLSELQVFKGFVFATGTQGNKACRLQDLRRLKRLQKLTISITTDANVAKGEMAELRHLANLRKLTITWSEIPSILECDSDTVIKRRDDLVDKWTSFELPQELSKLDLRCYPKSELKLKVHKNLTKLYLRGGDLVRFSIDETNSIKTLRLRYLKDFNMEWEEIRSSLKDIEYVEIVSKDEKLMKVGDKVQKDKNIDMEVEKDAKEDNKLVKQNKIKIVYSTLDENGVWVKDKKEEENLSWFSRATKEKEAHGAMENNKGTL
ncbi:unnamed protein product [Urochloa humidicola]